VTGHQAPPTRPRIGGATAVILAAILGVTAVVIALVAAGYPVEAADLATVAIVFGTALAVGFRRQWTR
jgi:FtsH-binding integral membrane protein